MREMREKVSRLSETLHDSGHFVSIRQTEEHAEYGKQVHEPHEVRVLSENYGFIDFLRRTYARARLYLIARYTRDEVARKMAREELRR